MKYCPLCDQAIRSADVAPPETRVYLIYRNGGRIKVITIGKAVVTGLILVEADWSETEREAMLAYLAEELGR